jgi:hypothetical protein
MTGKQRRPPRSLRCGLALGCAGLACLSANAQVLKQRFPGRTECPDTHLRLTARHADGTPAAGLRPQDLYLWFSAGTADIRTVNSEGPVNLLVVVRPGATLAPNASDAVMRNLQAMPSIHWQVAVLAPDGSVSAFTPSTEEASLRSALSKAAAAPPAALSVGDWSAAERNAFRQLQALPGRHVILELAQPAADSQAGEDRTLDLLARDDMAQIYRLSSASKDQFEATGGRAAPTIDALFQGIAADSPGSYDLVIHSRFSCQPGSSYSLRVSSFRPEVELYYPSEVRMATADSR